MRVLLFRHGPAGDKKVWARKGRRDELRPLTADGRRRTRAAAEGLAAFAGRVELVATSPLTRAVQTARLLAAALDAPSATCPALRPERPLSELLEWLRGREEESVALVGHEPGLSAFACGLLAGRSDSFIELKKAGAALIERAPDGTARLLWSLPPRALRALA